MQHYSCLLLDLFTAQKYHNYMVDLDVLSEIGGFRHHCILGLMQGQGGAQAPKAPPKFAIIGMQAMIDVFFQEIFRKNGLIPAKIIVQNKK